MIVKDIEVNGKKAVAIDIPLPNAKLLIVKADKGYLMCGYLNIETAEKLGDCAAIIRGVKTIEDLLNGKIVQVTSIAKNSGVEIGMTGLQALEKIIQ